MNGGMPRGRSGPGAGGALRRAGTLLGILIGLALPTAPSGSARPLGPIGDRGAAGELAPSAAPLHVAQGAPVDLFLPLALRAGTPALAWPDRSPVFGMQISEVRFRDPAVIAEIRQAGASVWRTFLFWDEVEPERHAPPVYDWRHYDPLFAAAAAQGLTVVAEIQGNPAWAADFPGGPPHDVDTLAQFLAAAVERYDGDGLRDAPGSPVVRYWELYNEPDNTDVLLAREGRGWGYWGFEGAAYARMLKRVYPVVKLASPQAQVVFGGIAYDGFLPDEGPFNPDFLDEVLEAGAGPFFDVMNFHFYPLYAGRWAAYGEDILGKTEALRRKLAEHGLRKPMLVTEAGTWSAAAPPYPPATPQDQLRYVAKLYTYARLAELEAVVWFQYDDVAGFDDPARGLVDSAMAAKPAWNAYRTASALLAGAVPERVARDPTAAGEVYWFQRGEERLAVAWTRDGGQASLVLRAPGVDWVQTLGNRRHVRDEADGRLDGITRVPYGPDPIYVLVPSGRAAR